MNIHAGRILTAGENALFALYEQRKKALPGNADVSAAREAAMAALKASGLPTRRTESWHYTDLRTLLRAVPDGGAVSAAVKSLVKGATVLVLQDGVALGGTGPDGVTVSTIAAKLEDGSFANALGARGTDDAVGQINTGLVGDGYHVAIADGAELSAPLEIQVLAGAGSHARIAVHAGAGAKLTIVERHPASDSFASTVSNVVVGDGAELLWIIDQERGADAVQLGQFNAWLGRDAKLTLFVMNAGGRLVRQEVHVAVKGEGADFKLRGVNLIGGESHVDVTMTLAHEVENTTSTQVFRNVVTGRGHGVFQGQIKVFAAAQKTDARMACNTLLLSDEGEFLAKPELEIFADDVACGHGATVAEINRDHLFYLMARGIAEADARAMLVSAFVSELLDDIDSEALHDALQLRLSAWLKAH